MVVSVNGVLRGAAAHRSPAPGEASYTFGIIRDTDAPALVTDPSLPTQPRTSHRGPMPAEASASSASIASQKVRREGMAEATRWRRCAAAGAAALRAR